MQRVWADSKANVVSLSSADLVSPQDTVDCDLDRHIPEEYPNRHVVLCLSFRCDALEIDASQSSVEGHS